jgi:hypothetical protein
VSGAGYQILGYYFLMCGYGTYANGLESIESFSTFPSSIHTLFCHEPLSLFPHQFTHEFTPSTSRIHRPCPHEFALQPHLLHSIIGSYQLYYSDCKVLFKDPRSISAVSNPISEVQQNQAKKLNIGQLAFEMLPMVCHKDFLDQDQEV